MAVADRETYLSNVVKELMQQWPDNRTVNIVCHGHSVPAGFFATPVVDTLGAYPHLLLEGLKSRFPFAVINVIVTAIAAENSESGAARFEKEVLCHRPDVVTIDYGLNDRYIGLEKAADAWRSMVEKALERGIKILLLTPTHDVSSLVREGSDEWNLLCKHAEQIRSLACEYEVGLVDSFAAFEEYIEKVGDLSDLLSWRNHPNRKGHKIVALEMLRWFPLPAPE